MIGNFQNHIYFTRKHRRSCLFVGRIYRKDIEKRRCIEFLDQRARSRGVIGIDIRKFDIVYFVRCCIGKNDQLNNGQNENNRKHPFVSKDLLELLLYDIADGSHYSNLILYFLILKTMKNTVIPIKIKVSFQMYGNPTPLSMMPLIITINHLAGIILLII